MEKEEQFYLKSGLRKASRRGTLRSRSLDSARRAPLRGTADLIEVACGVTPPPPPKGLTEP